VLHVVEALVALPRSGRAAEVVDRDGVVAGFGEALGQLHVEAVETAHVGKDDHRRAARLRRLREGGRELRAVSRGQYEGLGGGAARHTGQPGGQRRRPGVELEAHGLLSYPLGVERSLRPA
jgi:hypothetical protein